MPSLTQRLHAAGLAKPPRWLPQNVHYETMMGSVAYGVAVDDSDMDIYGFAIPPKEVIFPHLAGEIPGVGTVGERFEQYQQHHMNDPGGQLGSPRMYDVSIFSIVKFFQLCTENNPNMIDSLFTPAFCVIHQTKVREARRDFLHRGSWHKFKGYAFSQLHKMATKDPDPNSKRAKIREQYGFDVKFAYHVVRLLDEVEQILTLGDVDLQRASEHLKAIRRGEVPEEDIRSWFASKEKALEAAYQASTLPWGPDEKKLRALLLACLEEHYGSLAGAVATPDAEVVALAEIQATLDRYKAQRASP